MLPPYSPLKATQRPSGLRAGLVSAPSSLVRRRATPPSRPTTHTSLAWTKAMWSAVASGCRRNRVPGSWADRGRVRARAAPAERIDGSGTVDLEGLQLPPYVSVEVRNWDLARGTREAFRERYL